MNTTVDSVIKVLRTVFAHMELPDKVVTDNGPLFSSPEFENFLKVKGIQHTFSPTIPSS